MPAPKIISRLAGALDLSRFRGLVPVAVCLGLCLIAINMLLLALTGAAPRAFVLPQTYLDWDYFNLAADTVSGLVKAYTPPGLGKKPFLLYTGLSTAVEGIDPHSLAANDGCDAPVVGICGTGGSMSEVLALQKALLRTNLRPAIAVLCIHPSWLAGMLPEPPPDSLNPIDPLRRKDWHEAVLRVSWWNWLARNRFYANQAAFKILYATRLNLETVSGGGDPWREPRRVGFPPSHSKSQLQSQMSYLKGLGWFDPRRYVQEQATQLVALNELIVKFKDRGAVVLVAIMPETSAFRAREPAEPKQLLLDDLRRQFNTGDPPVFDFQDAIRDDGFTDLLHLNDVGRSEFTIKLAQAIKNHRSVPSNLPHSQ